LHEMTKTGQVAYELNQPANLLQPARLVREAADHSAEILHQTYNLSNCGGTLLQRRLSGQALPDSFQHDHYRRYPRHAYAFDGKITADNAAVDQRDRQSGRF